jgi:hypothetical protein
MSMLRGSIQALEVQRGTIATLKSVGASLASAVNTGRRQVHLRSNPYASAFFHHARKPTRTARRAGSAKTEAAKPAPEAALRPGRQQAGGQRRPAPMANPAAWWNMLQEQFKQAVASTVPPAAAKPAAKAAAPAKARPRRPPAAPPRNRPPGAHRQAESGQQQSRGESLA